MSGIEWTEKTWNPLAGCTKVSDGCKNCYAERMAHRFQHTAKYAGTTENGRWTRQINFDEKALTLPLRTKKPTMFFVNSMSDLFHDNVPDGWVLRIWEVIAKSPQHTFQILTKRPARMLAWMNKWTDVDEKDCEPKLVRGPEETRKAHLSGRGQLFAHYLKTLGAPPPSCAFPTYDWMGGMRWWPDILPNVWLGVSVENQQAADERIPLLLQTPAAVRFLSCEPLLGSVSIERFLLRDRYFMAQCSKCGWIGSSEFSEGNSWDLSEALCPRCHTDIEDAPDDSASVSWVIAGGESGPGARPMHPAWVRLLRDQCQAAGVPFFFKQWGEWAPNNLKSRKVKEHLFQTEPGAPLHAMFKVGKKAAGRLLDGRTWDEMPEVIA